MQNNDSKVQERSSHRLVNLEINRQLPMMTIWFDLNKVTIFSGLICKEQGQFILWVPLFSLGSIFVIFHKKAFLCGHKFVDFKLKNAVQTTVGELND